MLTFALTIVTAGTLGSSPGHFVGTPVTGAAVPIFRWSREVGDLRAAHFFATHAMHALPLFGLLVVALLSERAATRAVWAGAALFTVFVAAAFVGALAGYPLIPA